MASQEFAVNSTANSLAGSQRTIRLVDMVDHLIQKSYHDLVILAEVDLMNAKKPDMDRKIIIMQYLSKTRNYFIRFLALLKWSSSMPKVEKCFSIVSYLEEQSALFVETADVLARMARETLANSKLPCYQVSFAVDVLNSRTCPRLPSSIRDKFIPPSPLTEQETEETLKELEYALLYRLVTTDRPPAKMRSFVIRRGRVVFTVEKEFEISLTVMGDDKTMPFVVLDLRILVKNRRVGEGRALMHPQQVMYLQQLLQSRVMDNDKPLEEIYEILHSFCQSLQLDVLFVQLSKYMISSGLDYYRIDGYTPGRELKVSYWEEFSKKDTTSKTYSITIITGSSDQLVVTHQPAVDSAMTLNELDIGALMMSVIHARVKSRLGKLESELSRYYPCTTGGLPYVLIVSLYSGCPLVHTVHISVDYYTGLFIVQLQQLTSKNIVTIRDHLNSGVLKTQKIVDLLNLVRLELVLDLARAAALYMHLQEPNKLNLHGGEPLARFNQLGPFKIVLRFQKKTTTSALLAVSCHADATHPDGVRVDYYILIVEPSNAGLKVAALINWNALCEENVVRELQPPVTSSGPKNPLLLLKARLQAMKEYRGSRSPASTRQRLRPSVLDNFEQTVVCVLHQTMFSDLRAVLKNEGFFAEATVLDFQQGTVTLPVRVAHPLIRSCVFRRVGKLHITAVSAFHVEIIVTGVPFQTPATSTTTTCILSYDSSLPSEKIVKSFLFDWNAMLSLLRLMRRLKAFLSQKPPGIRYEIEYNLKTLKILYGPDLELVLLLSWDRGEQRLLLDFYGRTGSVWNPHRVLRTRLMELITPKNPNNLHCVDFSHVFDIVAQTTPLALGIRDSGRCVGVVKLARTLIPSINFQFFPVSLSQYVVTWRSTFGLYVRVLPGPKFVLTDIGSTEIARKSEEGRFQPTPGLRMLLENVLGDSLVASSEKSENLGIKLDMPPSAVDLELHLVLTKMLVRLKGYPVQLFSSTLTF